MPDAKNPAEVSAYPVAGGNAAVAFAEAASAHDGFHVREVRIGDDHSLHLVRVVGGVPDGAGHVLWEKKNPSDADYGVKVRLQLLAEALCRYVNTGGSRHDLYGALHVLYRMTGGATYEYGPSGFHLVDSHVNEEGRYEHVFAADDQGHAIRWVEGSFVDAVTLTTLTRQLLNEDVEAGRAQRVDTEGARLDGGAC